MRKTGTSSRNVSPRSNLYEEGSSTSGPKIPERTELKIFCIVEGEATPFPVKIPSNCSVGELQQAIKARKSNAFKDIDADKLTLYKVSIPDEGNTVLESEIESKEALAIASMELWEIFTSELPRKTIHIFVKLPPQDTQHPEIAALRKQLSDLEALTKNTSISLRIIDKRGGKKIVCTFVTDTKTATLAEFHLFLEKYFDQFAEDKDLKIFLHLPGSSIPTMLISDPQLRSILAIAKESSWKNLVISLDNPGKSFSKFTWKEVMEEYNVGKGPEFLPLFDIEPRAMTDDEKLMLEEIIKECSRKNEAYIFGPSSSEFTRNSIVDSFMVGAMQFYKADMYLEQQELITGLRGHGPVDFAVLDRIHQSQVLGVTEVKKDDHVKGMAQNIVQLDVALQQKKRKRTEADDDGQERPATRIKSFGIVTDAFKWTFVECTMEEDDSLTYKAKEVLRDLRLKEEETLREDAETLFCYVLSLYDRMKDEIVNRFSYNSPVVSRSSSASASASASANKRRASGTQS